MKANIKIPISIFCIFILFSFSKKETPATTALTNFKNYVDTILWINDRWKAQKETDLFFEGTPIDPNNPTKVRVDTIFITQTAKKTVLFPPWKYGHPLYSSYIDEYKKRLRAVEPFINEMNESMKKEFEDSKKKFEALMPPPSKLKRLDLSSISIDSLRKMSDAQLQEIMESQQK